MNTEEEKIIDYYKGQYEESGRILVEREKQSRIDFANFVLSKFHISQEARDSIIKELEQFLLTISQWHKRLTKAIGRIWPGDL